MMQEDDLGKQSQDYTKSTVNLVVGSTKIPCQLADTSNLERLLRDMNTDQSGGRSEREIRLPDSLHVKAVESVVEFIAGGRVSISLHSAPSVLECADLLGLQCVKDACFRTLSQSVSPANCLQLRQLAMAHSAVQLASQCDTCIGSSIAELLSQEEFLNLPRIQVTVDVSTQVFEFSTDSGMMEKLIPGILSELQEAAATTNGAGSHLEETLMRLVLLPDFSLADLSKGTQMNDQFSPEKPSLPKKLKKGQLSPARKLILGESMEELDEAEQEHSVTTPSWKLITVAKMSEVSAICLVECNPSVLRVVNITLFTSDTDSRRFPASPTTGLPAATGTALIGQMNVARSGFCVVPVEHELLAIGGFSRHGCHSSVESYNFSGNSWDWEQAQELQSKRARFSAVKADGVVYAIGGSDGRTELSSVEAFDQETQNWTKLRSSMLTPRSCFGSAELDGNIYAVGGIYYSTPLKTVEKFDPTTSQWKPLPSMQKARSDLAVASCGGMVYAIGGQMSGWRIVADVECYDPTARCWKPVASLNSPRRNAAVITIEDRIYVIGGYDGSQTLNTVEVYDPLEDTWTSISPMHVRRSGAAAALFDGSIYILGGYSGSTFLNSVECYNPVIKEWTSFV